MLAKLGGGGREREAGGLINGGRATLPASGHRWPAMLSHCGRWRRWSMRLLAVAQYSGSKIGPQLNRLMDQLHGAIYKLDKLAAILKRDGLDAAGSG